MLILKTALARHLGKPNHKAANPMYINSIEYLVIGPVQCAYIGLAKKRTKEI